MATKVQALTDTELAEKKSQLVKKTIILEKKLSEGDRR